MVHCQGIIKAGIHGDHGTAGEIHTDTDNVLGGDAGLANDGGNDRIERVKIILRVLQCKIGGEHLARCIKHTAHYRVGIVKCGLCGNITVGTANDHGSRRKRSAIHAYCIFFFHFNVLSLRARGSNSYTQ